LQKQQRTPTYLEGQFLARGDEFPSNLPHPLVIAPFPPFSQHYTVYKNDINNHGLLRPGHFKFSYPSQIVMELNLILSFIT
jgi:hypothetical protein